MIKSSTSNIVRKNSFLIFWFLEGTVRPYDMAIVEARYSCRLLITTSFSMNFYDLDIKFLWHLLYFFKCQCKKFRWFFKSTSFLTKNVSKQSKLAVVKIVNINYLRHNIPVQWQSQEAIYLFSNDCHYPLLNIQQISWYLTKFLNFLNKYTWVPW